MPLFEIDDNKDLVPFRQLRGGREELKQRVPIPDPRNWPCP